MTTARQLVSPTDRPRAVEDKAQAWVDAGSRLVWVVWPETRTVTIYRPGQPPRTIHEQEIISGEDVLPGFECVIARFFGA